MGLSIEAIGQMGLAPFMTGYVDRNVDRLPPLLLRRG